MRKNVYGLYVLSMQALCLMFIFSQASAQEQTTGAYRFDHGPYLQGLTAHEVYVYFTTSEKGFSSVELRESGRDEVSRHVTIDDGLVEANNTQNAIALPGLKANTRYEYRLVSTKIKQFRLSQNIYSDTIRTDWYSFITLNPKASTTTFITTSDIHDDAAKYQRLLQQVPLEKTKMVFLLGDILSHFSREGQPYSSFIDVSVANFAKHTPFVLIRGNHDTRGALARTYDQYIRRPDKHFYGAYTLGNTFIIMLDTGEDKPDDHHDYSGITAFDAYRQEQVAWLKSLLRSKEFKSAKHRIVMAHIPAKLRAADHTRASAHGSDMVYKLYMPLLNKEKIDLMISGHEHKFSLVEKKAGENNFPMLINDNNSISYYEVSDVGIHVKTVNDKGELIMDRLFKK